MTEPATALAHSTVVAIVGRPNVGKSTLFNRLVGERKAIVADIPGTTRDRLYADVEIAGHKVTLVDTGGLDPTSEEPMTALVRRQVEVAVAEAQVLVMVVDAAQGLTATDMEIAESLRATGKPILLVANKADNEARREASLQFYELGLGDPIPISAYHNLGIQCLLARLSSLLPTVAAPAAEREELALAIVGRPNVGKSLLLNAILGQERAVVSELPGTTRDALDTPLDYEGHRLLLIDTAGIRRPGRIGPGLEKASVARTREAIARCQVALLVTDATEGITAQDAHIAGLVAEAYKGLIIALNKWDLLPNTEEMQQRMIQHVQQRLRFVSWAPIAFVSAKTGLNVRTLLDLALKVGRNRRMRIPTHQLNVVIRQAMARHPPPERARPFKVYYVTQAETEPPTFVFFCNDPHLLHFSYQRFLENVIRLHFGFEGTAIKMVFRGRERER